MKTCIILRSASNAGKSTIAEYISYGRQSRICCADDYFTDSEGNYNWSQEKLNEAHRLCKEKFHLSIREQIELIIISNTNTTEKEYGYYLKHAQDAGYMVFSIVIENRHNKTNNHNIPLEILHKQANNIKNTLKLL